MIGVNLWWALWQRVLAQQVIPFVHLGGLMHCEAAVMGFLSLIPLAPGIIDPSVAQVELS